MFEERKPYATPETYTADAGRKEGPVLASLRNLHNQISLLEGEVQSLVDLLDSVTYWEPRNITDTGSQALPSGCRVFETTNEAAGRIQLLQDRLRDLKGALQV